MEPHCSSSSSFSFYYSEPEEMRKPSATPLKKALAPPPRTQPRVYKVDPVDFRDVVQKLTAPPQFLDPRLHAMPPPHPNFSDPPPRSSARRNFPDERSGSYNGYFGDYSERY